MARLVLRTMEGHTASVSILTYLYRKTEGRAYRREIEYEMYIQPKTAKRTLAYLLRLGLIIETPGRAPRTMVHIRYYSLAENGRRIAKILSDAESALDKERAAGILNIDLET